LEQLATNIFRVVNEAFLEGGSRKILRNVGAYITIDNMPLREN